MIVFLSNKTKLFPSNVPGDNSTLVSRYAQFAISRKHLVGSVEDHLRAALREIVAKAVQGYEFREGFDEVSLRVSVRSSNLTAVAAAYGDRLVIVPEVMFFLMGRETENQLDTVAAHGTVLARVEFQVQGRWLTSVPRTAPVDNRTADCARRQYEERGIDPMAIQPFRFGQTAVAFSFKNARERRAFCLVYRKPAPKRKVLGCLSYTQVMHCLLLSAQNHVGHNTRH